MSGRAGAEIEGLRLREVVMVLMRTGRGSGGGGDEASGVEELGEMNARIFFPSL